MKELFVNNGWILVISNVTRDETNTSAITNSNKWISDLVNGFNPSLNEHISGIKNVYFRMHGSIGQYIGKYSTHVLNEIFDFIKRKSISNAYIYFNNTDSNADAINDAKRMIKKFNPLNLP